MANQGSGFLSKMSIKQKIVTLAISVAVLIMSTSLFISVKNIRGSLLKANEDKVNQITEIVYNILESYNQEIGTGGLTLAEAQQKAKQKIAAIKYDGTNYVWINDYEGNMVNILP